MKHVSDNVPSRGIRRFQMSSLAGSLGAESDALLIAQHSQNGIQVPSIYLAF
jgi:hypothetical protein